MRHLGAFVAENPGDAQVTFRLPEADLAELKRRAAERGVHLSGLLRRLIQAYLYQESSMSKVKTLQDLSKVNVPIIGQPEPTADVLAFDALATIQCKCGGPPFLIMGITRPSLCPGCGQAFIIQKIAFVNVGGVLQLEMNVTKLVRAMTPTPGSTS